MLATEALTQYYSVWLLIRHSLGNKSNKVGKIHLLGEISTMTFYDGKGEPYSSETEVSWKVDLGISNPDFAEALRKISTDISRNVEAALNAFDIDIERDNEVEVELSDLIKLFQEEAKE